MFKKWNPETEDVKTDNTFKPNNTFKTEDTIKTQNFKNFMESSNKDIANKIVDAKNGNGDVNTILKGSKLTGDINVTYDLELSGDVEGNITSQQDSNIVIKGTCKGNIETREGDVDIEGELQSGNITAGRNVQILGKFTGGEVTTKGKIYVNGEFNGKLEGNEIEIGANAQGKGEFLK
jgi:cytoskeletal protein CcmA (bactofilin family)